MISENFLAGTVMAPSDSTCASMLTWTEMSRSVPHKSMLSPCAFRRIFERTGNVVRAGIVAETAPSPFCSFSRVMDSFIK